MKITAKKYIDNYDGHWEECKVEEIDSDDYILYVDGEQIEVGKFIKILLGKLEGI
jgi:hypothetical protein